MSGFLDSSILVAALAPDDTLHAESLALLMRGNNSVLSHAFLETFSTLTGGKLGVRVDADFAARLLRESVLPRVEVIELSNTEVLAALDFARSQGVRGGAVYDYMHFVAARKAKADTLFTANLRDFQSLRREGDPEIIHP